jgi:hypothetical protein
MSKIYRCESQGELFLEAEAEWRAGRCDGHDAPLVEVLEIDDSGDLLDPGLSFEAGPVTWYVCCAGERYTEREATARNFKCKMHGCALEKED